MRIGCHGAVWTGTFDTDGIRFAAEKTRAAGFDLLEVPLMDPYGLDVEATRKALADNDLTATASLGLGAHNDISSDDPAVVARGEAFLNKALEVVAEIGATHLVGVIYGAMQKYFDPLSDTGRQHSADVLGRLAARAKELDVRIGLEVVNRYESNLLNTGHQCLDHIARIGSDNVSVHLDTYHMNIEEPDMFSPVLDTGARLGYVHIGESHRGYLGSGTVDFAAFFRALADIGYDGPVVFESFSSAVVHPDLSRMLGIWRNLWTDSDDLGAHASAFIRGQLTSVASIAMH